MWSVKCGVRSVKSRVRSVKCRVWSAKVRSGLSAECVECVEGVARAKSTLVCCNCIHTAPATQNDMPRTREPLLRNRENALLTSKQSKEILRRLRSRVASSDPCTCSKVHLCQVLTFRPFVFLSFGSAFSQSRPKDTSSSATSWIFSASFTSPKTDLLRTCIRTSLRVKSF